jgi:hypothetical protein
VHPLAFGTSVGVRAALRTLSFVLLGACEGSAQGYPFSQRARVDQTVAFTDISIVLRAARRARTHAVRRFRDREVGRHLASRRRLGHASEPLARRPHRRSRGESREYSVWLLPARDRPVDVHPEPRGARLSSAVPGRGRGCRQARRDARARHVTWRRSRSTSRYVLRTRLCYGALGRDDGAGNASRPRTGRSKLPLGRLGVRRRELQSAPELAESSSMLSAS